MLSVGYYRYLVLHTLVIEVLRKVVKEIYKVNMNIVNDHSICILYLHISY